MGGVGSGGWNKRAELDYRSVRRIAMAKWLTAMRSSKTPEATKIKMAHEVLCRDIGKTQNTNITNIQTPKTYEELLKAAEELNAIKANARTDAGAQERPSFVLSGDFGGVTDTVSGQADGVSQGQ